MEQKQNLLATDNVVGYKFLKRYASTEESKAPGHVFIESKRTSQGPTCKHEKLAKVNVEKRDAFIKAWEEKEKTKAGNKYHKKVANVDSGENTKKKYAETKLKIREEELEKKKATYLEKMRNQKAAIHKRAEEKKVMAEAKREEEALKVEEFAAKYKAEGGMPKKLLGCFGAYR